MTTLRRAVPVLAAMTVAMTFSSCVLRAFGWTEAIAAVGLLFAAGVWSALLATRRCHGIRGERAMVFPAVFVVTFSFPLLLHGTPYVVGGLVKALGARSMAAALYASMIVASVIGAWLVATGMYWATGRRDRLLPWTMAAWGAAWPLLHLPLRIGVLEQASLLAWHLPVGLACAAWVLRCPPVRDWSTT